MKTENLALIQISECNFKDNHFVVSMEFELSEIIQISNRTKHLTR